MDRWTKCEKNQNWCRMFRAKMMMIERFNTFTAPTRLQW